jgi:peptide/nickel transport system permease protein
VATVGATEPGISAGPTETVDTSPQVVGRSLGQLFWRRFRRDRFALAGLVFIAIMILLALSAGWISRNIAHHGPNQTFVIERTNAFGLPLGPDREFWFGSDRAGSDVFVRVLYGARTSLVVAFFSTALSLLIGVTMGLLAGFYRGKVDTVVSRVIDIVMSLPVLLLAVGLAAACGLQAEGCLGGLIKPGLLLVSYVIGLFNWPYIARIVRGQVLSLREKEFIESARAQGSGNLRIMFREVLPNVAAPIIVYTTLIIPNNILFEAALSFLGVGMPPLIPSWGKMLAQASTEFTYAWWLMVFPGLFLFLTVFAFNLVGDGMRDALDPRSGR